MLLVCFMPIASSNATHPQHSSSAPLSLASYDAEELDSHIDKLHKYNELKDIAQTLIGVLGRLAETDCHHHCEEWRTKIMDASPTFAFLSLL